MQSSIKNNNKTTPCLIGDPKETFQKCPLDFYVAIPKKCGKKTEDKKTKRQEHKKQKAKNKGKKKKTTIKERV